MKLRSVTGASRARNASQVAAEFAGRHRRLLAAVHVAHGDRARLVLGAAVNQAPAGALVAGPLELTAELARRAKVDAGPQARGPGRRRQPEGPAGPLLPHDRDRHV